MSYLHNNTLPLQARRIFRLAFVVAVSLLIAYSISSPLPFIAPIFALMLALKPAPPLALKKLVGLLLVLILTLGIGLLLIPLLQHYKFTAILVVALGIYASFYLTINKGQALVGLFLTVGFTLISIAGTVNFALATTLIHALAAGITIAVISQWLVYPFFPEDSISDTPPPEADATECNWIALRGTLVTLPIYLLVLINPAVYMPIMMKGVALAQQSSEMDTRAAGEELLGSTFLGGCLAILFWMLLGTFVHLWMYFLFMLLFMIYFSSKIYQLLPGKYPASYWVNVAVTMLILLGLSVNDANTGKDVYQAFFIRLSLFVVVTLYAVAAVHIIEYLRNRYFHGRSDSRGNPGSPEQIDLPGFS
jgi:hypothetical protein